MEKSFEVNEVETVNDTIPSSAKAATMVTQNVDVIYFSSPRKKNGMKFPIHTVATLGLKDPTQLN